MPKAAQRQFLVSVEGIDGYFATKAGGDLSADVTTVFDGGSLTPERLASPALPGDVTVGRPFDPERDLIVLAGLRPLVGRWRTTVSVQATDGDLVAIGDPVVYSDCLLTGLTDPEADAASGDAAALELTFSPTSVT